MKDSTSSVVSAEDICRLAVANLFALICKIESGHDPWDDLREVRILLEAMPLPEGEFGLASNRLKNAKRYLQSHEQGAACWELNMLLNSLHRNAEMGTAQPDSRTRRNRRL